MVEGLVLGGGDRDGQAVGSGPAGSVRVLPLLLHQGQYPGRDRVTDPGLVVHVVTAGPLADDRPDGRGGVAGRAIGRGRAVSLGEGQEVEQELGLVHSILWFQILKAGAKMFDLRSCEPSGGAA